jgi:hypothetical protein
MSRCHDGSGHCRGDIEIKVTKTGTLPALDISISSTRSKILWDKDAERQEDDGQSLLSFSS